MMHCYASVSGYDGAFQSAEEISDDVASNPVKWGPVMKVPEGPGLGIDVDEKQIAKYRVKLRLEGGAAFKAALVKEITE